MPANLRSSAMAMAAVVLAACGGGSSSTAPAIPAAGSAALRSVTLTILIPAATKAAARERHAAYIASTTESLAITIAAGTATVLSQSVALTSAANPNCASAGGATTCTIVLGLVPGSYTGTFSTYDGPVVGGAASGHVLSQGQSVPIAVTGAQTNTIALTLDGVPAAIVLAIPAASLITGTQSGGFSVRRGVAADLTVVALDADGNTIIGPGAPAFAVASSGGAYAVAQPMANDVRITANAAGSATLTVTAAPVNGGYSCGAAGVVCSATISLRTLHTLFVANYSPYTIQVYTSPDDVTWTFASTITAGLVQPESLAFAPDGTLFVGNAGWADASVFTPFDGNVMAYAPPYGSAPAAITNGIADPIGMAVTSAGTLFVANGPQSPTLQHTLQKYAPPWTAAPGTTDLGSTGTSVVVDAADNLFVAGAPGMLEFSAPSYTGRTTIGSFLGPVSVASDRTLFAGNSSNHDQIDAYGAPPYLSAPITLTAPGHGGTEFVVTVNADVNGNVWITTLQAGAADGSYVMGWTKPFTNGQLPSVTVRRTSIAALATDSSGNAIVSLDGTTLTRISASGQRSTIVTSGINSPVALLYAP